MEDNDKHLPNRDYINPDYWRRVHDSYLESMDQLKDMANDDGTFKHMSDCPRWLDLKTDDMEEDNKYYTPNLNELSLHFEYEVFIDNSWVKINDFSNAYDYEDSCFYGFIKDLDKGNIRVKRLDRDDIKEFGFVQITDDCFNKSGVMEDCELRILVRQSILIYIIDSNNKDYTLFTGFIKNKSELQMILKMIGV